MSKAGTLLSARGLRVVRRDRALLDAIEISIHTGEMVALMGPNGAGKSTLLRVLAGLLTPDEGRVEIDARSLARLEPAERARRIAWLAQEGELHWPVTVERAVALGRIPHLSWADPWREQDAAAIERAMQLTRTRRFRARRVDRLSAGERARVMLARVLAGEPDVLLADEPAAALDPYYRMELLSLLHGMVRNDGMAVVIALHDFPSAWRYCDRLLLLDHGRLIADGHPHEVLTPERIAEIYRVRVTMSEAGPVPHAPLVGDAQSEEETHP
ncbi:MAG: ABC transporter ATP-binding protein [Alphaproteobacteria bacterium]|nr:MAG: ABC transporter ATP-binding protein [Alphaproteobacteria bacterium]